MKYLKYYFLISSLIIFLPIAQSCKDDDTKTAEICNDGIDNDGDGFIDCEDFDCEEEAACAVEICNDGIDNDGNGFTDCEDFACSSSPDC